MKIYPVADEFFHTDRPTDGQTDMMKLTIIFEILLTQLRWKLTKRLLSDMEQVMKQLLFAAFAM